MVGNTLSKKACSLFFFIICGNLFLVFSQLENADIEWHPQTGLKEYKSLWDAKIYVLDVPEYSSKMELSFIYVGNYVGTKIQCNQTISVLLQQGSPAIPFVEEIYTYNEIYNITVPVFKGEACQQCGLNKIIQSPLPGKWYVTVYLPFVEKVTKIKEKGLFKEDKKCVSAIRIRQLLTSPSQPPVVLAQGQSLKTIASHRLPLYFKYYVSSYSKELSVSLRCISSMNCSLRLSISVSSLPKSSSLNCKAPCTLKISWPQFPAYYYIEVSGQTLSYEIMANHTECKSTSDDCFDMKSLDIVSRKDLNNFWGDFVFKASSVHFVFRLYIDEELVGTTLRFALRPVSSYNNTKYKMCVTKDILPFHDKTSHEIFPQFCREKSRGALIIKVVYPQAGFWYVAIDIEEPSPIVIFTAGTQNCVNNCNQNGYCSVKSDIGISYEICKCKYGYSGLTCSTYRSLDILAICLLTISNIAFIPGIIIAFVKGFYAESIVYFFTMFSSTMYHACDSHGYCIYEYNTLQLSDFFASILSVWVTLVTMIKLPTLWRLTLNMAAVLGLFIGTHLARFSFLTFVVPTGIGLSLVFISFGYNCIKRRRLFPSVKRCVFFLIPGFLIASIALGIYARLETSANYKYLHSAWHVAIASCIPLLLPSVKKPKIYVDYRLVNSDENSCDSDESLMMNRVASSDEQDEINFPKHIT